MVFTVILVKSLRELMDLRRNFQSLEEHSFLSLKSDVSWPSDKTSKIFLVLDVTTNSIVSWSWLKQGVSLLFNLLGHFGYFLGSLRLFCKNFMWTNVTFKDDLCTISNRRRCRLFCRYLIFLSLISYCLFLVFTTFKDIWPSFLFPPRSSLLSFASFPNL